jgi:hypothetical protein
MTELTSDLLVGNRAKLPADLRFLVEKYPREVWQGHANLGEMAQFWLQRHDMFRELGGMLGKGVADYREGLLRPFDFAQWFAPRLRFFLQQLNGHHQIEDLHYFPVFAAAERRLLVNFHGSTVPRGVSGAAHSMSPAGAAGPPPGGGRGGRAPRGAPPPPRAGSTRRRSPRSGRPSASATPT